MFDLRPALEKRKRQGLYRTRRVAASPQSPVMRIDGRDVLSFCSNDYLGLANHKQIRKAFIEAAERYGVGSGAAHLVNGHGELHHDCEIMLAEFTGRERALLFSTGYMANLAVGSALMGRQDLIVQDRLNHASLIDSARLSGARLIRYRHNDLDQAKRLLDEHRTGSGRRLLMTDAVFSMDGDRADVRRLAELCAESDCALMVDDAHGFGVLGQTGGGSCEDLRLGQGQVPILMATLGKAVGVAGAFVAGSEVLIESLIQNARSYIYTTASPPAQAAAVMESIRIIQRETWRRDKLLELIDYFRQRAAGLDCRLLPSDTAIQPVIFSGDNDEASRLSQRLFERGLHITAIRPPTVPENTARLRITLSAAHEKTHIDRLIDTLAMLIRD
jgi:8-amino-7-oxononanoate synthase